MARALTYLAQVAGAVAFVFAMPWFLALVYVAFGGTP